VGQELTFDFHRAALLLAVRRRWKLQRDRRRENPERTRRHKEKGYYSDVARSRKMSLARYHRNAIKYRASNRRYIKNRLKTDSGFQLMWTLRSRVRAALRDSVKHGSSIELLGCGIEEYREYLAGQFKPGMSWENYGRVWHVDHKRPCASFDLRDPGQQRQCFNWSNTQPLFKQENLRKGKAWS
jgi:hypothetical protein